MWLFFCCRPILPRVELDAKKCSTAAGTPTDGSPFWLRPGSWQLFLMKSESSKRIMQAKTSRKGEVVGSEQRSKIETIQRSFVLSSGEIRFASVTADAISMENVPAGTNESGCSACHLVRILISVNC